MSNLQSDDPNVRREEIEKYFYESPSDEILQEISRFMQDPDLGVRNSLSILFTTTDNPNAAKYIVEYVSSEDISVRNLAGDTMLKMGERSVEALTEYIDIGNDDDKKFCIDLLGLIGDPMPAAKIGEVLNTTKDKNVILACIESLGNLKSEASVDLIKTFFSVDELYKPTVIEALGKIGSRNVEKFLIEIYSTEDELTQYAIIESLGLIGEADSLGLLMAELKTAEGFMIGPLVNSIYYVKDRSGMSVLVDEKTADKIVNNIDSMESRFVMPALSLVQSVPNLDILPIYVQVFGSEYELDNLIRAKFASQTERLLEILTQYFIESPKNMYELLSFLKEEFGENNNLVEKIKEKPLFVSFMLAISNLLIHENEEIRSLACDLLFLLDENRAIEASEIIVNDQNVWTRINLLDNLMKLESGKAEKLLKLLSEDNEEMVRERAVFALDQKI